MRRGLLKEVRDAFGSAIAMCGSMHPDDIDGERARLAALEKEVIGELRKGAKLDRNMAMADGRIGKQEYA